ncbi:MAG: MGMT family protein, partial [Candidatus Dadabacteria bacterium]
IPIVVPCHRVVARSGLGGYAGDWENGAAETVKRRLLELEALPRG